MRRRAAALLVLALATAFPAAAEEPAGRIAGRVTPAPGVEPETIVVYLVGYEEAPADETITVSQKGMRFTPDLVAVTAGQEIAFPNDDDRLHHLYSPQPRFDLGTYPPGETRTTRFEKPGVLDVYCNLHPMMALTVIVVPNRRFATTAPDGTFAIDGVRPGRWSLFAYHRRATKPARLEVEVRAGETTEVHLEVPAATGAVPAPSR